MSRRKRRPSADTRVGGTGSGGGDPQALCQVLVDHLLGGLTAATASGADAPALCQVAEMHGAIVHGLADFLVGDGFAEADVHGVLVPVMS